MFPKSKVVINVCMSFNSGMKTRSDGFDYTTPYAGGHEGSRQDAAQGASRQLHAVPTVGLDHGVSPTVKISTARGCRMRSLFSVARACRLTLAVFLAADLVQRQPRRPTRPQVDRTAALHYTKCSLVERATGVPAVSRSE